MAKKIICILISVSMLLSMVCVSAAPAAFAVDDTKLDALKALEIVNGYETEDKLLDIMEKSTFINFLLNIMYGGKFSALYSEEALKMAEGLKIIDNAEAVRTGDTLKGNEAVKMAMCLLGYRELCLNSGGYPVGFLSKANQIDLTMDVTINQEMSNADAYKLLYNTMDAPIAEIDAIGVNGDEYTRHYTQYEDVTILSRYRKIYTVEGVVDANKTSGLTKIEGTDDDSVKINDYIFYDPQGLLFDALGYKVRAFAEKKPDGNYEVIYAEPHEENNVTILKTEDIKNVSSDIRSIEYYTDGNSSNTKKSTIKPSVAFVYNNAATSDYTASDLKKPDSVLTLIDNDGDKAIDVIKLDSFKVMIVSTVSASSKTINSEYSKYDGALKSLVLDDYDDSSDCVRFFYDGKAATFEDIRPGDVLSVFESKGKSGKSIDIHISTEKPVVTVAEYNTSENEILANDTIYELSDTYFAANAKGEKYAQTISAGKKYQLYLDVNGKVAGAKVASDNALSYGYLRETSNSKASGFKEEEGIKLFDTNADWLELYFADKVRINGKSGKTVKEARDEADKYVGEIIGYELDNEGKIKTLELPVAYDESVSDERLSKTEEITGKYFRYNNTSFDSTHYMYADTKVIFIPTDELDNEDLYDVGNNYSFQIDEAIDSYIGYNVDEYNFMDLVLVKRTKNTSTSIAADASAYMVRKVSKTLDNEGTPATQISVASSTYLGLSMLTANDEIANGINPGDIIQIHVNAKGYIDNIKSVFDIDSDIVPYAPSYLHAYDPVQGYFVKVDAANGKLLLECPNRLALKVSPTIPVLIFEADMDNVKVGSLSELSSGDYVFATISKSLVTCLFVYRNL